MISLETSLVTYKPYDLKILIDLNIEPAIVESARGQDNPPPQVSVTSFAKYFLLVKNSPPNYMFFEGDCQKK